MSFKLLSEERAEFENLKAKLIESINDKIFIVSQAISNIPNMSEY